MLRRLKNTVKNLKAALIDEYKAVGEYNEIISQFRLIAEYGDPVINSKLFEAALIIDKIVT